MKSNLGRAIWEKPARKEAAVFSLLAACFLAGLLAGVFAAMGVSAATARTLQNTLSGYVSAANTGTLAQIPLWTVLECLAPPLLLLLLGTMPIGVGGIPLVFGITGFSGAYGVALITRLPGINRGFLAALALSGGKSFLLTISIALAGLDGFSRAMALRRMAGGTMLPVKQYVLSGAIAVVPAGLAALWELWLTPRLAAFLLPLFQMI